MKRLGEWTLFLVAIFLAPLFATVVYLLVRGTLPSEVPDVTDWQGLFDGDFEPQRHGVVNGGVVPTAFMLLVGLIVVLIRGLRTSDRRWVPSAVAGCSQWCWFWCLGVVISIGAPSAASVHPQFWQYEIVFAVSVAQGVLVYRAMPRQPRQLEPAPASPFVLGPTERVFWFGRSLNRPTLWRAAVLLAASIVAAGWSVPTSLALLILAAFGLLRSAPTVRINDREVRLWSTPVGWPHRTIGLHRISRARVVQRRRAWFRPATWSEDLRDQDLDPSSAVFGNGPVLVLEGPDTFPIALSLPDAAEAADLVNALIARNQDHPTCVGSSATASVQPIPRAEQAST